MLQIPAQRNEPILRSQTIQSWWPTTQSLDLVEGPIQSVASALETEIKEFIKGEKIHSSWEQFSSLGAAFQAAPDFTNVPTFFIVLPTRSRWSVLWNNCFLCDGYDSLCLCLTKNHRLTTVHWSSHDDWTTFQSGSRFIHRRFFGGRIAERSVHTAQDDKRWHFYASGDPLPEEDTSVYSAPRKQDRLNEKAMAALLSRFGAAPLSDEFYTVNDSPAFVLQRTNPPPTVLRRPRSEVV